MNGAQLSGNPPLREWLVPDMIPSSTVSLLYGDGGTGKSLIALQLAVATVSGQIWLNKLPASGPVIYYSAEDDRGELHRRLDAIHKAHSTSPADMGGLNIADMAGKDALLATIGKKTGALSPTPVFDNLDEFAGAIRPKLIVLDTLADIFPGNENDRAQVRHFVGLLRGLAIRHQCAVLTLAHPSLSGIASGTGASGSTAWNNSVRSRLYFERLKSEGYESDPDARRLKVMKSNYGPIDGEIAVRWQDGVFIASQSPLTSDNEARAERIVLDLIERNAAQGRYFTALRAPGELATMPGSEGLSRQMLKRAMERLFAADKLTQRTIWENRRDRTVIALDPDG
ncbi:MAG: AAA family ATPase [Verrucomicrobiales bacterium]|nr:AAA family ATPase [Verrucomicrobiales bacterium]